MHFMQTIFPIVFIAVVAWVALIWAIVIIVTIRNVIVAAKNRGKNDKDKDGGDVTDSVPTNTSTYTPTIAGMPAGVYYATHTTQMTDTFNHTPPTIY